MIDSKRLNESINEIERQAKNIKSITETHKILERTIQDFKVNTDLHKLSVKELEDAKSQLISNIESFEEQLKSLQTLIKDIGEGFNGIVNEIKTENDEFNKNIMANYAKLENDFFTQIQTLSTENKKFYLELENILSSKLERNKSDIEVEIRNQGNGLIKEIEKIVDVRISNMERELKTKIDTQNKKLSTQQFIVIGIAVIAIVNLIVAFVR